MNKEQIEKAAAEYMKLPALKAAIKCGDIEDLESHIKVAYKRGAEWRINSVWHNTSEIPRKNTWFIAQIGDDCFDTFVMQIEEKRWCNWCKGMNIKHWAYLEDLISERKEGAE